MIYCLVDEWIGLIYFKHLKEWNTIDLYAHIKTKVLICAYALNMDTFFVSFYIWYLLYNYLVCVCLQYVKAADYCEQMKFYHFF